MKNFIALFAFVLFAATAQSQSLSQQDITGSWRIVTVENASSNPKLAASMTNAWLNFNTDKSFELKEKQENGTAVTLNTVSQKNAEWSYNESNQTITTTRTKMTLKVSRNGNKVFFTDKDSGLKFEVIKPI
jgi:hypothetical protein